LSLFNYKDLRLFKEHSVSVETDLAQNPMVESDSFERRFLFVVLLGWEIFVNKTPHVGFSWVNFLMNRGGHGFGHWAIYDGLYRFLSECFHRLTFLGQLQFLDPFFF
jgi:hypothetical protein